MFKSNAVNLKITKIIFPLILNDFKEIVYSFWWQFQMQTVLIENVFDLCVERAVSGVREFCAPEGLYWLYVFDSFVSFLSFVRFFIRCHYKYIHDDRIRACDGKRSAKPIIINAIRCAFIKWKFRKRRKKNTCERK